MNEAEVDPYDLANLEGLLNQQQWIDLEKEDFEDIPSNDYYQFRPPPAYQRYYRLFRKLVLNQEKSKRCMSLTTFLLRLHPNNYYALMLRKNCIHFLKWGIAEVVHEVVFVNYLLSLNSKEYQLWTYKKYLLNLHHLPIFQTEIQFLQELLSEDQKNYHVWDYKLWLTIFYNRQKQQLNETSHLLYDPPISQELKEQLKQSGYHVQPVIWSTCYSLWSFRFNLAEQTFRLQSELLDFKVEQIHKIMGWIKDNLKNQSAWSYLSGLIHSHLIETPLIKQVYNNVSQFHDKDKQNRFPARLLLQVGRILKQRGQEVKGDAQILTNLSQTDEVRNNYYFTLHQRHE